MKKPFVVVKSPSDVIKLSITILACAFIIGALVASNNKSVAAFSGGTGAGKSFYSLVGELV